MNRYLKIGTVASLTLAVAAGSAFAQGKRGDGLRAMDADKSGSVSLEEFQANMTERFARFDSNSDGTISAAELTAIVAASENRRISRQAARIRTLDTDWNGELTTAEVEAASVRMFERADRNDDGQIDRSDRRGKRGDGKRRGDRR